jgi:RNA polymerase sigma-70 factor, ECF subfamily
MTPLTRTRSGPKQSPEPGVSRLSPAAVGRGPDHVADAVRRARDGDRDALAELYSTFSEPVFRVVYRILQDSHEAEDVTQHVFIKLMSILPQYERRQVPFSAWLLRVARNMALDAERRHRPVYCEEELPGTVGRADADRQLGSSLRDALSALPAAQRRVVLLRHVAGFSAPEVAERLGKTTGSVHALDQRGRRTLKRDLRRAGSAPATVGSARSTAAAGR